jgi:hypothetical protein
MSTANGSKPNWWQSAVHDRRHPDLRSCLPVSWADADVLLTLGAVCSYCHGISVWRDHDHHKRWCCSTCHPPPPQIETKETQS